MSSRNNRDYITMSARVIKNIDWFMSCIYASLTINENADPDVRLDMETALNRLAPENVRTFKGTHYIHADEGSDDMPAHIKSSIFGSSVSIPITKGNLNLGTWQGIWMCEHRDRGGSRNIVVTMQGVQE
ncbi:hypothetical protein HDU76_012887 [Blyttiomyces sp. JEL0837]|nr:hypothetical protein HDU76_012887 [Blyttiomyces sp. JEL0837]